MFIDHIIQYKRIQALNIFISQVLFIPRHDISVITNLFYKFPIQKKYIIDICSGSGIIGMLILRAYTCLICMEINISSLFVAIENIKINNFKGQYTLVNANLLSSINIKYKFCDIIISNPPYIEKKKTLRKNTKTYESCLALILKKENVFSLFRRIIYDINNILKEEGYIIIELDFIQIYYVFSTINNNHNIFLLYSNYYIIRGVLYKKYGYNFTQRYNKEKTRSFLYNR